MRSDSLRGRHVTSADNHNNLSRTNLTCQQNNTSTWVLQGWPPHTRRYSNRMMQHAELSARSADHHSLAAVVRANSLRPSSITGNNYTVVAATLTAVAMCLRRTALLVPSSKWSTSSGRDMTVTRVPPGVVRNAASSCLLMAHLLVSRLQSGTS